MTTESLLDRLGHLSTTSLVDAVAHVADPAATSARRSCRVGTSVGRRRHGPRQPRPDVRHPRPARVRSRGRPRRGRRWRRPCRRRVSSSAPRPSGEALAGLVILGRPVTPPRSAGCRCRSGRPGWRRTRTLRVAARDRGPPVARRCAGGAGRARRRRRRRAGRRVGGRARRGRRRCRDDRGEGEGAPGADARGCVALRRPELRRAPGGAARRSVPAGWPSAEPPPSRRPG